MTDRKLTSADIADRVRRYGAEWTAAIRSTDRADRPRAECAFEALYRASGRREPDVVWVKSPAAGMLAAGLAAHSRTWVRGDFTRGDVGDGARRDWHALAEPFDVELAWRRRLTASIQERVARHGLGTNAWGSTLRAFGLDAYEPVSAGILRAAQAWTADAASADPTVRLDWQAVDTAGSGLLGNLWTAVVDAAGLDLGRTLFVDALRETAEAIVDSARDSHDVAQAMQPGQFDTFFPLLAANRTVFESPMWRGPDRDARLASIDARLEISRSAGPWWAFEDLVVVSERPLKMEVDERGRPHSDVGPALAWPDGFEVWAVHGVRVESWVVTDLEQITVETIDEEDNAEVKRVLIERFGHERLIREGNAELIHEDRSGKLWRRRLGQPWEWRAGEPIVVVEVENSTPEPDGSRKTYFLRVPPHTRTASEGVAWTFGMSGADYGPAVET